jgi:rare lipoprotein A (peptidoglycan hydrolase)
MYVRTAVVDSAAPSFDMSSATTPSAFDRPHATWLPPDRIVVEPEVVPYRPTSSTTPSLTASAPLEADGAKDDSADEPDSVALPVPTTATATERDSATTTTTTPTSTTSTTTPVAVTLPAALTPVGPVSTGAATESNRGWASWFGAPEGTCAHRTIPRGTVITVTRVRTAASTTCVVDDWGPADTTRIIDLSTDTFEQLAPSEAGLIEVIIDW